MILKKFAALILPVLASCTGTSDTITVEVTDEVINAGYIGNGVEWDPYDEAESWGAPVSDADWDKLFSRLDYMRPGYVRCMINSPFRYYNAENGKYEPDRNSVSLERLLKYCTDRGIMVVYGEYNPPHWEIKESQQWIDMSVDYLNRLVNEKGFSCIKHFVIFNEPDGNWASTNGDFDLWLSMAKRFHAKMAEYPGLLDKVSLAGPDAVADYRNRNSKFGTDGWLEQTVLKADSIIGLYDIHSYPGQAQVRSGEYGPLLASYRELIPADKKIVLGEAGYKYWREADSLLMAEYNRRVEGHPFTRGSDCNMLVYDYFYGIDMPLLAIEVMNNGFSGVAAWMLDDAMHSQGDSGKPQDIKLWGMWNILGDEVFNDASQEEIRPWFYTWSLVCRYFPAGCDILKTSVGDGNDGIFTVAARKDGKLTFAVINLNDSQRDVTVKLPQSVKDADIFRYEEGNLNTDANGYPAPADDKADGDKVSLSLAPQSMTLITELKDKV